jgi:hypothetical protein
VGGPPPYVCRRLVALAVSDWSELNGELLSRGVALFELPLPWALDVIYSWAIEDASTEQRRKFDEQLQMPPAGTEVAVDDEVWSDDAVFAQFMVAAGAAGR